MADEPQKKTKARLARSIAEGSVRVNEPDHWHIPDWVTETYVAIDMPFKVLAFILLAMIGFSFGGFVQDQLFTEAKFLITPFFIEDGVLTGEWM